MLWLQILLSRPGLVLATFMVTVVYYEGLPLGPIRYIPFIGSALSEFVDGRVDRAVLEAKKGLVSKAAVAAANARAEAMKKIAAANANLLVEAKQRSLLMQKANEDFLNSLNQASIENQDLQDQIDELKLTKPKDTSDCVVTDGLADKLRYR